MAISIALENVMPIHFAGNFAASSETPPREACSTCGVKRNLIFVFLSGTSRMGTWTHEGHIPTGVVDSGFTSVAAERNGRANNIHRVLSSFMTVRHSRLMARNYTTS